jgi:hypothetical protein
VLVVGQKWGSRCRHRERVNVLRIRIYLGGRSLGCYGTFLALYKDLVFKPAKCDSEEGMA